MKKYPFVSIVVPVYNGERTIAKCIKSLLNLDYPKDRYEIIVVDNNSKDRTKMVVSKYPVKLLEEKKRQSPGAARNKGIKYAKGEYIAFIDADEWADKGWLKDFIQNISGYSIAVGKVLPQLEKGNIWEKFDYYTQLNCINEGMGTGNMIVKKEIFNQVGDFKNVEAGEDVEFVKRARASGIINKYSPGTVVFHTTRKTLLSVSKRGLRLGKGYVVIEKKAFDKNFIKNFFPGFRTYYRIYKRREISFKEFFGLMFANIIFYWSMNFGRIVGATRRKNDK